MSNPNPKIRIDDIDYEFDTLPSNIQEMVIRYDVWTKQETEHKFEMEKASFAREKLNGRTVESVRSYNATLVKEMQHAKEVAQVQTDPGVDNPS